MVINVAFTDSFSSVIPLEIVANKGCLQTKYCHRHHNFPDDFVVISIFNDEILTFFVGNAKALAPSRTRYSPVIKSLPLL
jgi:hypothetical protein